MEKVKIINPGYFISLAKDAGIDILDISKSKKLTRLVRNLPAIDYPGLREKYIFIEYIVALYSIRKLCFFDRRRAMSDNVLSPYLDLSMCRVIGLNGIIEYCVFSRIMRMSGLVSVTEIGEAVTWINSIDLRKDI